MGALKKMLTKLPPEALRITRETLTVKDKIAMIIEKMETEHTIRFDSLFEGDNTRLQVIVTFLALLEILRLGMVRAYQDRDFGAIWIMKHKEDETQPKYEES